MEGRLQLSGTTQVVGVIGDPVAHSHSPAMHNAAFTAAGLDWVYVAWRVEPAALAGAVAALTALGVRGFNVTVPHKVALLPLLDEVSEEASAIGAANTVVIRGGRLRGENTDAQGFLRSLVAAGVEPRGLKAVLLGSGGAARAVGYALVRGGVARLHLANRTGERACRLAQDLAGHGASQVSAGSLAETILPGRLADADLVIQATSAELSGASLPIPLAWLPPHGLFYDLTYGPASAGLLADVRRQGLRAVGGEEMLIHQGALAFSLWTGSEPSLDAMRLGLRRMTASEEESSS